MFSENGYLQVCPITNFETDLVNPQKYLFARTRDSFPTTFSLHLQKYNFSTHPLIFVSCFLANGHVSDYNMKLKFPVLGPRGFFWGVGEKIFEDLCTA